MIHRWRGWSAWALALTLAGSVGTGRAEEARTYHSGTVEAFDKTAGSLVVGEVGPWRVREGKTEVTRRTIRVTASTEWVRLSRAEGAGPLGWIGEGVEASMPPWEVKAGDIVTVEVRREGRRFVATKIGVATPDQP